jgi:hypothetical protein
MVSINTLIVGVLEMLALASSRKITIQVYVLFGFVCGLVSCNVCEFPLLINGALPYLVLPGFLCLFLVLGDVRYLAYLCLTFFAGSSRDLQCACMRGPHVL